MKQANCEQCHRLVPVNETLSLVGRQLCRPCAADEVSRHPEGKITADSITRHVDPTVCAQCGSDNGESDLPKLANVPLCSTCESHFRNRPYPAWLKLCFAALVALALFSFAWNWRFMAAYREMRQVERALIKGDVEKAAQLSESAARHVPEAVDLGAAASMYRGLVFLKDNKSADALKCFQKAAFQPAVKGPMLTQVTLLAEAGVAFDAKDYDEFLKKEQALVAMLPNESQAVAGLASAYACKYVVSGNEKYRKESLKRLEQARKLAGPANAETQEYVERIQHRLDTRQILTREEYVKRFPSGYHAGDKK
jgi:tetratricopeptide (TPR) repeat protein